MVAEVAVVRVRIGNKGAIRSQCLNRHEAIRRCYPRERTKQDPIDPGENSRARTDANGQREHCKGGERAIAKHHPQAIAKVLKQA